MSSGFIYPPDEHVIFIRQEKSEFISSNMKEAGVFSMPHDGPIARDPPPDWKRHHSCCVWTVLRPSAPTYISSCVLVPSGSGQPALVLQNYYSGLSAIRNPKH